ncbi:VOC family protein [Rhodosalinus halophilus]|uniref:VOC family protein n=2 Tax=Rhodosalinus halophilus TaxID=2259333 RepID=A0A365UBY1_9RHOB|nr:VOC family protein [Rhodosalinus halophilus]
MEIDHLAVAGETLEAALAHVEAALGVTLAEGGRHARFGTWNRLLSLGEAEYLEAIAVDPEAAPPGVPRWFGLDALTGGPRLQAWIVRVADLDAAVAALPEAGRAVPLERGDLRWRMAVPEAGALPWDGVFPALIEWEGTAHPAPRLPDAACRLESLEVRYPAAEALAARLGPHLSDPRVRFVAGTPGLAAEIATPAGTRRLA